MIKTKRAILVANGNLQFSEQLRQTHTAGDLLIGVDAEARHCLGSNLIPDLVVGDFDSLGADTLTALQEKGVQLVRYPSRKDETDLELAIGHAREAGATEILIFGALGARWDMTLANLLLLSHPSTRRMKVRLFDGSQEITTIHSGENLRIRVGRGGRCRQNRRRFQGQ